jgi:two-component system, OmpR family, response regulator MtrA
MREGPPDSVPKQLPPLVILVGEAATDHYRIHQLLDAGSVIVIARSAATVDAWLPRELLERVEHKPPHVVISVNKLEVNLTERRARWSGHPLDLTEHELNMLTTLAEDPDRAWTFEELVAKVWGVDFFGDPDMVHAAVKRLRKKLAKAGADLTIQSVRGVGFRLAGKSRLRRMLSRKAGRRQGS